MAKKPSSAGSGQRGASSLGQLERFKQIARELGCDEDEAAFEEKLTRIAHMKIKDTVSTDKPKRGLKTRDPEMVSEARRLLIKAAEELGAPVARPVAAKVRDNATSCFIHLHADAPYPNVQAAFESAIKGLLADGVIEEINSPVPTIRLRVQHQGRN